ncbi:MAG TPA: hypothetical protein VFG76_13170 [Candidatus Polarisedimenticolia bacterium]|nr:hypothetical protein [Candidatus Polarisedimenticolia bacterium]
MIGTARSIVELDPTESVRIVVCKKGPGMATDQALIWGGAGAQVETVATLAEGFELCLHDEVDHLVINMFSCSSAELTALAIFRSMRPRQHVIAFCSSEMATMLLRSGLADDCHPMAATGTSQTRRRRATP